MNLEPVANELERLGLGEVGRTIFINHYPAEVSEGILIRPRLIGAKIDHYLPGYLKFQFQLIARAPTHAQATTLCIQAAKGLTQRMTELGDWHVNYLRPQHVPVAYPISIGELVECNCDMDACIVDPEWV